MAKPFPDFSSPEFQRVGPRGRLYALREYVMTQDAPVPPEDLRKLFAETCEISVELLKDTRIVSHYAMEADESMRLLNELIAFVQPEATA